MDNRSDGLWQGGPWEQPAPVFPNPPAVRLPTAVSRRPVLRVRRRRRKWPWFLGLFSLVAVICLSTILLDRFLRPRLIIQDHFPSTPRRRSTAPSLPPSPGRRRAPA